MDGIERVIDKVAEKVADVYGVVKPVAETVAAEVQVMGLVALVGAVLLLTSGPAAILVGWRIARRCDNVDDANGVRICAGVLSVIALIGGLCALFGAALPRLLAPTAYVLGLS